MAEEMMHYGLTPYESWKISNGTSKRPSGAAIAGLVLGSVGTAAAIGAWVFGPVIANNRARGLEKLADAQFNANQQQLNLLTNLLAAERNERVAQGLSVTQTINDTISGQQTSTLTAQQAAELSSIQSVQQNLLNQAVLGNLSENPQKVQIYSAPQPCGCPGCGCNN